MGRALGFIGVLLAVAIGMYVYSKQAQSTTAAVPGASSPRAAVDITGVRNDLVAIANGERRHFASEGKYVSLDELRTAGDISLPQNSRGPYDYSVDVNDAHFKVVATYSGSDTTSPRRITINDEMQVGQE